MSRGTYTVYKPQRPDSKQDSWRSCTCSVIIFVVICLLILLVAWPLKLKNAENGHGNNKENIEGYSAAYKDSKSDAEIIPVNNTDDKKTANVISQIPLTTPNDTEVATTGFRKAHFVGTTQFNNFEESTQTSTTIGTTHSPFMETETVKTTKKDFIDRTLSESISTTETLTERKEIINKIVPTLLENVTTSEAHTETEKTSTTHKSIHSVDTEEIHSHPDSFTETVKTTKKDFIDRTLSESVSTTETPTERKEIINKIAPTLLENVPTLEAHTETEKTSTTHKSIHFVGTEEIHSHPDSFTETVKTTNKDFIDRTLSESVSTTETPTERKEIINKIVPTLLENVPTSEAHTETEKTSTTHKSIHSVGTEEIHSHPDSFTTNSPKKYTSSIGILHSETSVTTDPTDTAWKIIYPEDIPTTQKSLNTTMSSTMQIVTTESIIPTEHSKIESFTSNNQNNKLTTSSTHPPNTLSQNGTDEYVESVSRTFNNYNVQTTSNKSSALENSTLSTLLSSVKDTTDITLQNVEIKSTETTKSYEVASTTPYTAPKTTTEPFHSKLSSYQVIRNEEEENVCDTNTCKNIASKSLSFMKHDENICEDFYSHACGGISKDYLVERDPSADFLKRLKDTIENTGEDSSKYAIAFKNYFTSCMNYDYSKVKALDPAQEALSDVGFFCDKNTEFPSLTTLLTKLLKKNFPVLFDVILDVDPITKNLSLVILPVFPDMKYESLTRNNENEKFVIDKTKLGKGELNLTEAYMMHDNDRKEISKYVSEVRQALESFKVFDGKLGNNLLSEVLIFLELTILDAQTQFLPTAIKRRREFQYKIFTTKSLPNLQKNLNLVNWEELLTELVGPLPNDIHVQVYFMSYLSQVLNTLKTTDKREMHNSILALYTHHLYKQYSLDQKKIGERTSYCLKMSSKQMQDVSSALYLESFQKNKITSMYEHAKDIFERLVNTLYSEFDKDWLSEIKNEQFAKTTIENLTLLSVADHLPWKNPQDLINRLEKYDVNITCFIVNTNALQQRNRELLYKQLGNDPMIPENLWTILYSPFETKLSIVKSLGRIVVPLGALSYHLDNPAYPKYVSMADLGFNIAKQINLYLELSAVRILKKNDGAQPENQFIQIKPSNGETPMFVELNPSDLSTEIITDVAGAKLAYMAYKNYGSEILSKDLPVIWANKTTGQLYFLLLAQEFCTKRSVSDDLLGLFEGAQLPPMIVMNSIAVNTDEFYDLNGCNGETTMTAAIKVLLPSVASTTEMDPMDFSDR